VGEKLNEREQVEQLLIDWYRWSKRWRPHLGAPRVSVYCRQSRTSRQYDEDAEDERVFIHEMKAVEWCVNELPIPLQVAIGLEMRNREARAKVWVGGGSYSEALSKVTVLFKKRGIVY